MLTRFRNIVEKSGSFKMKSEEVSNYVLDKFIYARERQHAVHDMDIRRWGLQKARSLNFNFKASVSWVYRFKIANNITSRKAKIVSMRSIINQEDILNSAKEFQEMIKKESWK